MSLGIRSRQIPRLLIAVAVLVIAISSPSAQIPDKFENLKVLPKDISKQDLINVMTGFAGALGMRCHNCHVGEPGPSLEGYDFVSDKKEEKEIARQMMKMVDEINKKHIAPLKTHHATKVEVGCRTCHHGQERPRSLPDVLGDVHAAEGKDAMLAKYNELYERFYGADSFDFGEWALDGLAQKMAAASPGDALALMQLHAENHGESSHMETVLGMLEMQSGNKEKGVAHLERALEIDPKNRAAKRFLDQAQKEND